MRRCRRHPASILVLIAVAAAVTAGCSGTKKAGISIEERLAKAEEVLKLKRTKPLKAWESTLDACINLRVRTG